MSINRVSLLYKSYERHIASLALFGGFIFDILTLRRADNLWENSWVIGYLVIVAVVVLLLNKKRTEPVLADNERDFWLVNLLQFSFGGLLSAFLILYFRSASIAASWPFLLLLALIFIGNERLKKHYERLTYQVSVFFLALLLFFIFFVPVVIGVIGPWVFILSGVASLLFIRIFLAILESVSGDHFLHSLSSIRVSILSIFIAMNIFYFTNIIPPIPLSLREGGVYHSVDKEPTGEYVIRREDSKWYEFFIPYPEVHPIRGQSLYAYTSVFSPAKFRITAIHEWQFYDEEDGRWVTTSKIPLPISGGRDQGFRTYSYANVEEGKWRINVLTEKGQILGRIGFKVAYALTPRDLVTEVR
jgi:Protein of unknown function (DUF2914)